MGWGAKKRFLGPTLNSDRTYICNNRKETCQCTGALLHAPNFGELYLCELIDKNVHSIVMILPSVVTLHIIFNLTAFLPSMHVQLICEKSVLVLKWLSRY